MGWTYYHLDDTSSTGKKKELDTYYASVVKSQMVGNVYYAAYKAKDGNVSAAVVLTAKDRNSYYNFGYKDMTENIGPGYYDCPSSILDLLTPTDNESANEWRNKCRVYQKNKKLIKEAPIGTIISWKDGSSVRYAEKVDRMFQFKKPFWLAIDSDYNSLNAYIPHNHIDLFSLKMEND